MVRLLVIEPGYCPYTASFTSVEAAKQETIQGEAQLILPFDTPKIGLLCSLHSSGMKYNRQISEDTTIYGSCLVCGVSDGKAISLTREQADRYSRKYFLPESPLQDGDFPVARVKPTDERFGGKMHFWER